MSPSAVYTTISRSTELPQLTDNTIIVILGASGDLAKNLLYPALFKLFSRNLLPRRTAIVGYARSKFATHDDFFTTVTAAIRNPGNDPNFDRNLSAYKANLSYFAGSYDDGVTFDHFNKYLEIIESSYQFPERNRVFYLALPTFLFPVVVQNLRTHVYSTAGINRIVIAKPIGSNLKSARELVQATGEFWSEDESIRICRYLAEEIVKNVLVFRCANKITNGYWEHQQMTHLLTVSLCDYSDFAQDAALPKSLQQVRRFVHHKVIATSPEVILSALKS